MTGVMESILYWSLVFGNIIAMVADVVTVSVENAYIWYSTLLSKWV